MDPVSHALLGGTLAYVVGGKSLGWHAAAVGVLAGMTPDLDHFVRSETDPLLYVQYHRFFTHSLLFSFVGALLPMLPWLCRAEFRKRFWSLWVCAWAAYLSHCLLDASTTWGTQLYWPFSNARAGWDIIAIVDPIFTLALAFTFSIALWRRRRGIAVAGLTLGLGYLGFGAFQHSRALKAQDQLAAKRQHTIEKREVMPTIGNNVVWRSIYLADGRIYSDRVRVGWFSRAQVRPGGSLPLLKPEHLSAAEQAANAVNRGYDRFHWFSSGWLARAPGETNVIGDMRYSRSSNAFDPVWGIRLIDAAGNPKLEWVSRERDRNLALNELWSELTGKDSRFATASN